MAAQAHTSDATDKLESMSLDEMRGLRKEIDRAIASYEGRQRQAAVSAAEEVAKEHGFKLTELVGGRPTRGSRKTGGAEAPSPAAYANPDNPSQTWSGRGRRPGWFLDAISTGKTKEDLAI